MLEKLRRKSFLMIDKFLNNNLQSKDIQEVKLINDNLNSETSNTIIERNLRNLLKHATLHSVFYKGLDCDDLKKFPVINKEIINKNHSKFLTGSIEHLFETTTSGSTGTPLIIYQDKIKRRRHIADAIYFNELAGYILGSKLYYFRVWNKKNSKSLLMKWFQNIEMIDISVMSPSNLDQLLKRMINDKSEKSILSFASSLDVLKSHCFNNGISLSNINLNCIISMSEALSPETRAFFEESIQGNVVSRYSNMENGFIAQQERNSSSYKINQASFYVEILDMERDEPVPYNTMGRIVVTDLFNYGMPVIRYDTGDIGIMGLDRQNKLVLKSIEGRRVDFITNTKGELLSPHTITNSMWFFADELHQFQFIQNDHNGYTLKLNMKIKENRISVIKIYDTLIPYLGKDAQIKIEYVDEIPLLSSGKRKKVVNKMLY